MSHLSKNSINPNTIKEFIKNKESMLLLARECHLEESLRAHKKLLTSRFEELVYWVCCRLATVTKAIENVEGRWVWKETQMEELVEK